MYPSIETLKNNPVMMQPTIKEIEIAYRIAEAIGTPEAKRDLQRIRERKTTWVGSDEVKMRFAIDRYLTKNAHKPIDTECSINKKDKTNETYAQ